MSKKGKSAKSPVVQGAVIAKHLTGASKSQIARDLRIGRNTVYRILSEAEMNTFVEQGKSAMFELIPDAIAAYGTGVKADRVVAESHLERMKVLPVKETSAGGGTINNFIGIGSLARPDTRKPVLAEPKTT